MSKVSIVAFGSSPDSTFLDETLEAGENADESRCAISVAGHEVVMLSGNLVFSITRTSAAERRPRMLAEAASSSLRTSPSPSAFPSRDCIRMQ